VLFKLSKTIGSGPDSCHKSEKIVLAFFDQERYLHELHPQGQTQQRYRNQEGYSDVLGLVHELRQHLSPYPCLYLGVHIEERQADDPQPQDLALADLSSSQA
jgi:hypothetical protein